MRNAKYLLIIFVLMFWPLFLWAEDDIAGSRYFLDGMTWKEMTVETYMMSEIEHINKCTYMLQGDTLIREKLYHKLVDEKGGLIATMREEGKQIYLRFNETDMLLYDFGVEVGDTIVQDFSAFGVPWSEGSCKNCVVRIDTVMLLDGREAKRICYDQRGSTDLEFVGSEYGILAPVFMPEIPTSFDWHFYSCCSLNGNIIFEHNQGDCTKIDNRDAIDTVHSHSSSVSKLLREGLLFIERNGKKYSVTGQQIP